MADERPSWAELSARWSEPSNDVDAAVEYLMDIIARASRMAESERAAMTQQILQEALRDE